MKTLKRSQNIFIYVLLVCAFFVLLASCQSNKEATEPAPPKATKSPSKVNKSALPVNSTNSMNSANNESSQPQKQYSPEKKPVDAPLAPVTTNKTSFPKTQYSLNKKPMAAPPAPVAKKVFLPNRSASSGPSSASMNTANSQSNKQQTPYALKKSPVQTESTSKSDPYELVDIIVASMKSANIAFNTPQKLNINETAEIQLLLSMKKSIEELKGEITSSGQTEGDTVKVANRMEAKLTGSNFQITAITEEEQAIGKNDTAEWNWEIKPQSKGRQKLHLTLTAIFVIDGKKTPKTIRTFDKTIEVEVTAKQASKGFIAKNWQWLCVVIIFPIAGWLWKRRKSQKINTDKP
jgi:hypothetical protein